MYISEPVEEHVFAQGDEVDKLCGSLEAAKVWCVMENTNDLVNAYQSNRTCITTPGCNLEHMIQVHYENQKRYKYYKQHLNPTCYEPLDRALKDVIAGAVKGQTKEKVIELLKKSMYIDELLLRLLE